MDNQSENSVDQRAKGKPRGRYRVYLDSGKEHLKVPRQTLFSQKLKNDSRLENRRVGHEEQMVQEQQLPDFMNVDESMSPGSDIDISNLTQTSPHLPENQPVNLPEAELPASSDVNEDEPSTFLFEEEQQVAQVCVGECLCGQCKLLTDTHEDGITQQKKYKDRYNFNEPIAPGVDTTKFEVFLLVLHMALRHGMSGPLIEDQLKFVNAIFGKMVIPTSQFIFKRLFAPKGLLEFHFYCINCNFYLGEKKTFDKSSFVQCEVCDEQCNVCDLQQSTCFVTLPVKDQLEELINRPDIKLMCRSNRDSLNICDFMDGSMYKDLCKNGGVLSDPNSLTITFNSDGAKVYRTGKCSLWPIQFIVNEIDPSLRFRAENVGLLGLWFGRGSPDPSTFMTPFILEMQELAKTGVTKFLPDGTAVKCPVFGIACSLDGIAQAKFAKRKQHNGHCACGYCYHPNDQVVDPSTFKSSRKFTAVDYPYRTHKESVLDMHVADLLDKEGLLKRTNIGKENETWDDVRGMKGITPFIELPGFDTVFSFAIDYMHNMMNVMEKIHDLLFSSGSSGKDYYVNAERQRLINKRLKSITPPQGMSRGSPRSLDDFADWKAIESRSFILIYMLPCLDGVIPQSYFNNLRDLVSGYQILLQDTISPEELSQAAEHLQNFVKTFNGLYGDVHMTYNIHLCSHLARMVSLMGPLWCYSAYPFESGNGHLVKLVKGTRGVITQIAQKYVTVQAIPKYVENFCVSQRVIDSCREICSYSRLKHSVELDDGSGLGLELICEPSEPEKDAMRAAGLPLSDTIKYFIRVVRNKCVYYSAAYEKRERFNDTCVSLIGGQYAVINKLAQMRPGELWAFVNPLRLSENEAHYLAPHIKTCASRLYAPLRLIPFTHIIGKVCLVKLDQRNFVCLLANRYERN